MALLTRSQRSALPLAARRRPEDEVLLCCARLCLDAATAVRLQTLLQEDLDWVYLHRTALSHGLLQLLYWHLKATAPEAVPPATLQQLQEEFHATAGHNLFLADALVKILQLLAAHEIPALPFKGPVLATTIYGNLALRMFSDLDILVHKRDFIRARDVILAQGYRFHIPLTDGQAAAWARSHPAYTLVRADGRVTVDLHWRIAPRYFACPLEFTHLREHVEAVCLGRTMVSSLTPEALLVLLCVHGAKHAWARLVWLCDVAELIRARPEMAWGRVMAQAETLSSRRRVALGLLLAQALLDVTLPPGVLHRIQVDARIQGLVVQVRDNLFRAASVERKFLFPLQVLDGLGHQVQYVLHRVDVMPNVKDRAFLPLPVSLAFLAYLIRPVRLVYEYGWRLCYAMFHRM